MANNCLFEMEIVGDVDDIEELEKNLIRMGRVYTADFYAHEVNDGKAVLVVEGDCAWSLHTAFGMEDPESRFRMACASGGLSVKAYSREPGVGFQEHYVLDGSELEVAEETPYREYWLGDEDTAEEAADELGVDVALLLLMAAGDETVGVGGYEWDFAIEGPAEHGPTVRDLVARARKTKATA